MSYDNTNSGTLGKNKRKEKDTHPDYTGQVNINGVDYWLNAWLKTNGSTGEKFFSLSVRAKDQQHTPPSQPQAVADSGGGFDDDCPFAPHDFGSFV